MGSPRRRRISPTRAMLKARFNGPDQNDFPSKMRTQSEKKSRRWTQEVSSSGRVDDIGLSNRFLQTISHHSY